MITFTQIEIQEKFYSFVDAAGTKRIVRRDVYWDSGFKSESEIELIKQIESQLEQAQ